jgi:hypothetical protein
VAQSQGIVNQTAGGVTGNAVGTTGAGATAFGTAVPFAQMGQSGFNSAANIQNLGYQNALARYNANQQGSSGFWGGIGSLAGELGSAALLHGADGGAVPSSGIPVVDKSDGVPAMLSRNEYIIPADVVRRKGTEFFDKLLAKYKDGGDYHQQQLEQDAAVQADNATRLSQFTPSYNRVPNSPIQPYRDQQLIDRSRWEDVARQQGGIPAGK